MIETLQGFPDNIVAFVAKGRITRSDYETVLIPKVEEAFGRHKRIRCYCEIGTQFAGFDAGAAWEDMKLGIGHLSGWERVAVVTNTEWIRLAMHAFRFLIPGAVRVFGLDQAAEAQQWIQSG